MSRSKNFYQGISLGRVQRSEYDDAKMRDIARHDTRLGESLKTVERAKNVMKKSMEADRQMFMKTGSPTTNKTFLPLHGAHARSGARAANQHAALGSDPRMKRFSVTERPSINDLDSSVPTRRRSVPRPTSYHEQFTDLSHSDVAFKKELGPVNGKHSDPNKSSLESVKAGLVMQAELPASPGISDRLRESDNACEIDQRNFNSTSRALAYASRYEKMSPKTESQKTPDGRQHQRESTGAAGTDVDKKTDDPNVESDGDIKNKLPEQGVVQDQECKAVKRPTLWDTLSTPKYTSKTKSKRSQIEMEFTASRLKGYKSSPALFSAAKVKGQGKPPIQEAGGLHRGQVGGVKMKQSASSRVRNDE